MRYEVEIAGRRRTIDVRRADGRFAVTVNDRTWIVDAALVDRHTISLLMSAPAEDASRDRRPLGGLSYDVMLVPEVVGGAVAVQVGASSMAALLNGRRRRVGEVGASRSGPERLVAPMSGKVVRVLVSRGERVHARQGLVVIEAMKMENELRAGRDGVVVELAVRDGQLVDAGALVAVIADKG